MDRAIADDETILAEAHLHWVYTLGAFAWLIFGFWLLGYGVYKCIAILIRKATTEICITDRRFIFKQGWLTRQSTEFDISTIEGCNYSQSFLGRILGYGNLAVRGTGVGEIVLPLIARPVEFRRAIIDAKSKHQQKFVGETA